MKQQERKDFSTKHETVDHASKTLSRKAKRLDSVLLAWSEEDMLS